MNTSGNPPPPDFSPDDSPEDVNRKAGLKRIPCRWCGKEFRQPIKHEPYCSKNPDNVRADPEADPEEPRPVEGEPVPDSEPIPLDPLFGVALARVGGELAGLGVSKLVWKDPKRKFKVSSEWVRLAAPAHLAVAERYLPDVGREHAALVQLLGCYAVLFVQNDVNVLGALSRGGSSESDSDSGADREREEPISF